MIEISEFNGGFNGIPQFSDHKRMWSELKVQINGKPKPAVDLLVKSLRGVFVNGGVRFQSFYIDPHPVFDWYASRNQLHRLGFFEKFWLLPVVNQFMSEDLTDLNFYSEEIFSYSSPFMLGGAFAWTLSAGGAYQKYPAGGADAKQIGESAANELIQNDFDNTLVYESNADWSDFFCDVAWDFTWIVLHKKTRVIHVLVATDTD